METDAKTVNDQAIELTDDSEWTLNDLIEYSREKISSGDYQGALEKLIPASEGGEYSDFVPIEGLKADCYRGLHKIVAARECYENILALESEPPYWVYVGYANVLEDMGEQQLSIDYMFRALENDFNVDLAQRLVMLSGQDISGFVDRYLSRSNDEKGQEKLCEVAESLIVNGYEIQGKSVFESLEKLNPEDVTSTRKLVSAYIKTGDMGTAITELADWKTRYPGNEQLDQLLKTCEDSCRSVELDGLPCFFVEEGRELCDYVLRVNGIIIRDGLNRFSLPVQSLDSGDAGIKNKVFINIPKCYVDSKSEQYSITVTELFGDKRNYESRYSAEKMLSDRYGHSGHLDYKGGNRVRGWLYSSIIDFSMIKLYLNDVFVAEIEVKNRREDVANKKGSDYLMSGFDYEWDASIDVQKIELREPENERSLLGTPIHFHRRVDAVTQLEKMLINADQSNREVFAPNVVASMFKAVRSLPEITTESTIDSSMVARHFEEGVSIVVPIYNAFGDVYRCLSSILSSGSSLPYEIVCINDCSPDKKIMAYLEPLAEENENISLVNSEVNRGFVKTVNKGLAARRYRNVIILNSDTVVPHLFVDRLQAAYDSNTDYGVITPLSNNATIFSFPLTLEHNQLKNLEEINIVDELVRSNAGNTVLEAPTGHGFCMFVAGDVLERVGYLDEEEWGIGYGEENDFCQRVKMQGWRIGAHYGMYVGHIGSVSFGDEQRERQVSKNLQRLNQIYPEYENLIEDFIENEGNSRVLRNKLQILNWQRNNQDEVVLLISHSLGGGTTEYIDRSIDSLENENVNSLLLTTDANKIVISDAEEGIHCVYAQDEIDLLKSHLDMFSFKSVVINSTFNYPIELFEKFTEVAEKYIVVLHDYSWFCPKINLIDSSGKYCGVPGSDVCVSCIKTSGPHKSFTQNWKDISSGLDIWLTKNLNLLENAHTIIAPSHDAAKRIKKKFPSLNPTVKYHDDVIELPLVTKRYVADTLEEQTIGVFGMIGDHKGLQIFKSLCSLLSSRHPGISIVFFGALSEYEWMDEYSNVKCVGVYDEETLGDLIAEEKPTASLFLSPWPETYCYALTDAIKHAVFPIVFDIGAFAERIEMHNYGKVIPFDTHPESIYTSVVEVLTSAEFKKASSTDIKSGMTYRVYSEDYFQVESTIEIKSVA